MMIVDGRISTPAATVARRGLSAPSRPTIALALLAGAYLPLLAAHAVWLWGSANYGFALLLPPVVALAARDRLRGQGPMEADRPRLSLALAILALVLLVASLYAWFPWSASVSFLVLLSALIYGIGGRRMARTLRPVWFLACLMVPLPFAFDQDLTVRLQSTAVTATSGLLDLLDVEHLREGNTLRLVDTSLFVSDACSGIHSFFVTLAGTFAFLVWRRSGAVRGAVLLSAAGVFVFVENVTRLTVVALAWRAGHDLRSGWPHELLGIGLFAATILLVGSAYRLLEFLSSPTAAPRDSGRQAGGSPPARADRSWFATAAAATPWLRSKTMLATAGVAALAAWVLAVPRISAQEESLATRFGDLQADSLPASWNGWKQTGYRFETRPGVDPLAEYSYAWTYELEDTRVTVGLSHSYPDRHDLRICYRHLGYLPLENPVEARGDGVEHPGGKYYAAEFSRSAVDHLLLHFDLGNAAGLTFDPETGVPFGERLTNRIAELKNVEPGRGAAARYSGPYFHVQALVQSSTPLTEARRAQVRELFLAARELLKRRPAPQENSP